MLHKTRPWSLSILLFLALAAAACQPITAPAGRELSAAELHYHRESVARMNLPWEVASTAPAAARSIAAQVDALSRTYPAAGSRPAAPVAALRRVRDAFRDLPPPRRSPRGARHPRALPRLADAASPGQDAAQLPAHRLRQEPVRAAGPRGGAENHRLRARWLYDLGRYSDGPATATR